ncbi:MAG: PH domain-containing protein [Nocardioidaceae bacterium]
MSAMRAPSDRTTYHPLGARVVALAAGGCLTTISVVMWVALPSTSRDGFSYLERITLVGCLVGALGVLYAIARTSLRTDEQGIVVLNGFRRHRFAWAEVVAVGLARGAPWAMLDVSDGSTCAVMAIQRADGERALAAYRRLRSQVDAHAPH